MIWVVFAEIVPESMESANSSIVATCATVSASGIEGFRMSLEYIADHGSSDLPKFISVWKIAALFLPMLLVLVAYSSRHLKRFFYLGRPVGIAWLFATLLSLSLFAKLDATTRRSDEYLLWLLVTEHGGLVAVCTLRVCARQRCTSDLSGVEKAVIELDGLYHLYY